MLKINYTEILKKNMLNVFKEVLNEINKNGLNLGHHLYITFETFKKEVQIPRWLKEKFPKEMTIVIQYEYWDLKIFKTYFKITLSFDYIKTNLSIPYDSIISFADPYANFGLRLKSIQKLQNKKNKVKQNKNTDTNKKIVDLKQYKKKLN